MLALENERPKSVPSFPAVNRNANSLFAPHFGLDQHPFLSNLDRRQFYPYDSAMEVINTVQYALRSGEGITKIVGESGSGKTFLTANLLATMSQEFHVIKLLYPASSPRNILKTILDEMCIEYQSDLNNQQLTKLILAALCGYYAQYNHPVVLVIDNAERMPVEALAALNALDNLETQYRKLLQIVLVGSYELNTHLEQSSLASLRQRIGFSADLKPMSFEETKNYVNERVRLSQSGDKALFSESALNLIFKYSRGLPRLVNLISYKAMMLAFGQGVTLVGSSHIKLSARDTQQIRDYLSLQFPKWGYIPFVLAFVGCVTLGYMKWLA